MLNYIKKTLNSPFASRMESSDNCVLISQNPLCPNIELSDEVSLVIGRSPETKIKNTKCSKQQIQLTANYSKAIVTCKQIGQNASQVSDCIYKRGETFILKHGEMLNLVKGTTGTTYKISFSKNGTAKKNEALDTNVASEPPQKKLRKDEHIETDNSDDEMKLSEIEAKLSNMKNTSNGTNKPKGIKAFFSPSHSTTVKPIPKNSNWFDVDRKLYVFSTENVKSSTKIAAFDLDGTLICTKSGKVFPTNDSDWKIIYPEVQKKLKALLNDGYKIVIFTNQAGMSKGRISPTQFKTKLENVSKALEISMQAFVSPGHGCYRKPLLGMWEYMVANCNDGLEVDLLSSNYVGDAAGRIEKWEPGRKKDFSLSDRLFALNLGIPFSTPEEFFLGKKSAPFKMPEFRPSEVGKNCPLAYVWKPNDNNKEYNVKNIFSPPEVIVLVGYPASGKSFFSKKYLVPNGYTYINRDTIGTWQKCVSFCEEAIMKKQSVVIDNTNPDKESRMRYTELAAKHKMNCRCFYFECSLAQAKHNNTFREVTNTDKKHVPVNIMVLNSFKGKLKEPELSEGFAEIVKVNFIPSFSNAEHEKLYRMFLLEN